MVLKSLTLHSRGTAQKRAAPQFNVSAHESTKDGIMDQPLTKWYCDVCGGVIEDVSKGYVIWKSTKQMKSTGFKIIHQTKCDHKDFPSSSALRDFIGIDGLARLLALLSIGPLKEKIGQGSHCDTEDMDEFVDFFRRVQTPFYEEARRRFGNRDLLDDFSDSNEVLPYMQDTLCEIIGKYGTER